MTEKNRQFSFFSVETQKKPPLRTRRLGDVLQRALADIFLRDVSDARLKKLIVSKVSVTPDLSSAKIYIYLADNEEERRSVQKALKKAAPFVRLKLSQRLELRRIPNLQFFHDQEMEAELRIQSLLNAHVQ